jgi:hypothetical protein
MQSREPKIKDIEILEWARANLEYGCGMPMGVIEALAWESFKHRGVKRHGFGGKIRRLFPAHCRSSFPHRFKKGNADLFVYERGKGGIPRDPHKPCRGLWSLKAGPAQALAEAAPPPPPVGQAAVA